MLLPAGNVELSRYAPAPTVVPLPRELPSTTAPAPIETLLPMLLPGAPRITAPVSAWKFWPIVNGVPVPVRGALIVTPEPVWAIEPMLIVLRAMGGWPWSARMELLRPRR